MDSNILDWTNYLPKNGLKIQPPSMPDATMALDSNIEANALLAGALSGSMTGNIGVGVTGSGGGYIRLDSVNVRLIMGEGANKRCLLGKKG